MFRKELKKEIEDVDWDSFNGSSMYESNNVASSLYRLIDLTEPDQAEEVGNNLINSIGSNHTGVYFPALIKALDFIIEIKNSTQSKACRVCSLAVLNDLYYFELDMEGYNDISEEELKKAIKEKLSPYSDELIEFWLSCCIPSKCPIDGR